MPFQKGNKLGAKNKGLIPWNKGKPHMVGILNPMWGRKHTAEAKKKVSEANKGRIPSLEVRRKMSLASKGKPKSKEHRENIRKSANRGDKHYAWKGDNVGYASLHRWVQKHRGVANKCEQCESAIKVEWANISREYKREQNDYMQLCHSCHMQYDSISDKVWATRKKLYGYSGKRVITLTGRL